MSPKENDVARESKGERVMMPFLDTFYSLASNDPSERNFAASSLIQHVFSKDITRNDVTIKDGAYSLTRLLMGVCSGRASARQGMASCLATFLKTSFHLGPDDGSGRKWVLLFMEDMEAKQNERPIEFIRRKLVEATCLEAPKGKSVIKKSRSDERDAQFGRLFGILAVVRSGILNNPDTTLDDYKTYVSDLVRLYSHKKWFREPAVHAMNEFFSSMSAAGNRKMLHSLVDSTLSSFFQDDAWTSEKIAIYLFLQTLLKDDLPKSISEPLLTTSNLRSTTEGSNISIILRDTSNVVHPRIHIVWKAIWTYICESDNNKSERHILILRKNLPAGEDSAENILLGIIQNVVIQQLLGDNSDGGVNATHERRALALSVVHQLLKIKLPNSMIEESVLHHTIVKKLFINTLQKVTGSKGSSSDTTFAFHTLQPLARFIIEQITEFTISQELNLENRERRICIAKSFLKVNPNFDSVTQTETIYQLLGLVSDSVSDELTLLWNGFSDTLMTEIINLFKHGDSSIMEANKFIDVLYSFAKRILRFSSSDGICKKVLVFFLLGAFFDLNNYRRSEMQHNQYDFVVVANVIKDTTSIFPYVTRVTMSSRFFSLLSESCCVAATEKGDHVKEKKILAINTNIEYVFKAIKGLEASGATLCCNAGDSIDDSVMSRVTFIYNDIQKKVMSFDEIRSGTNQSLSAFSALVSSLCIQVLHPGEPDEKEDDAEEEEDVTDDVLDTLSDISEVLYCILGVNPDVENEEKDEDGSESTSNLLVSLATISVSLFNSSLGGSFTNSSAIRGGASKLVRDSVSLTWNSALNLASMQSDMQLSLDSDVINVLLGSVCSEKVLSQGEEEIDDEEMDENMDDSEEDSDQQDISLSFSKIASSTLNDESSDEDDENSANAEHKLESDDDHRSLSNQEDEALDPLGLEKLLIQDSDDDDIDHNILEHHEGADAALAQLIKMKQDARKKAQEKREKSDLSNRLRCLSLLEAVYSSAKRTSLLSNQAVLMPLLPLLRSRTELLKSLSSYTIQKSNNAVPEKRSLMEKITNLIENKICKVHLEGTANIEACKILADQVMVEMKRAQNIDHSKCCSAILVLVNKAVSKHGKEAVMFSKGVYEGAVLEWSTRKTTRLQAVMFEDLIYKVQHMAYVVLPFPLVSASKSARSSFLQAEAFRLLAILYQKPSSSYEPEELHSLQSAVPSFIESVTVVLQDETMTKAKRVREVIKSAERLVAFITSYGNKTMFQHLATLGESIKNFENGSSNYALVKKLHDDVEKLMEKQKEDPLLANEEDEVVDKEDVEDSRKSKKKSNKKKNKKNKK